MNSRAFGLLVGTLVTSFIRVWRSNWIYTRRLLFAFIIILAVPPVEHYWLARVAIPQVPVSSIIGMFAASLLLLSFASVVYVCLYFLRQALQVEKNVNLVRSRYRQPVAPTSGSFNVMPDNRAWAAEELERLKKSGILLDTDKTEIEDLARDMGFRPKPTR